MKLPDWVKKVLWGLGIVIIGPAFLLWVLGVTFHPWGDALTRWYDSLFEKANKQNIATECELHHGFRASLAGSSRQIAAFSKVGASHHDHTYICDNASIEAPPSEFPKKLADTYPGCFTYETMITHNLSLNEKSPAVCRALYRVDENGRREPTTYELGVIICLGARARTRGYPPPGDQQFPRPCSRIMNSTPKAFYLVQGHSKPVC